MRGLDPVERGHADIHHHHVGLERFRHGHGFAPIAGFADNREIGLRIHHQAQAGADQIMIVGQQHADLLASHSGLVGRQGQFRQDRRPAARRGIHREIAAEALDALFHAEDAQAARALRDRSRGHRR